MTIFFKNLFTPLSFLVIIVSILSARAENALDFDKI